MSFDEVVALACEKDKDTRNNKYNEFLLISYSFCSSLQTFQQHTRF